METQLFQLKFTSKQLARGSKKCEKNEKDQKLKLKKVKIGIHNQLFTAFVRQLNKEMWTAQRYMPKML